MSRAREATDVKTDKPLFIGFYFVNLILLE